MTGRVPGWVFPASMVAGGWTVAIALGVVVVRDCEDDYDRAAAYRCSTQGRRDEFDHWLSECLRESSRSAVECEAFAHRQIYDDGECRREVRK